MKTKVLLFISFVLFAGSQLFAQTTGGPDAYGYVWASSTNTTTAATPVYNWKEIKNTGTQIVGLGDDNRVGSYNMNWPFHFYWNDFSKFWVGSNGWISFNGTTTNIAAPFSALPWANAKNTLDPMLCDLTFVNKNSAAVPGATAWYWTNNTDTLIVQYDSIPYWTVGNALQFDGRYTFQIILSGVDSSITYQYKIANAGTAAYSMTGTGAEGLTTGIENSTGSIGLEGQPTNAFPTASTSVKFYYPHPVTYQVYDVTPAWSQNTDNGGFFVSFPCGKPVHLTTDIANVGNQDVTSVGVSGQLFDASLNSVWSSSGNVTSLHKYSDSVFVYPATYAANATGDFIFRSSITGCTPADINSGNDMNDVELVVVDTTQGNVGLSYCTATSTATVFSFGSGEGGGVYFVPPFYPAIVTSIDYFIAGTTGTAGFTSKLIKDDGANGSPGTVLNSVVVPNTSVVNTAYNTVTLATTYTITSGGVYAAWIAGGDSIQLGTDQSMPFSNRNFEDIGGSWSTYRNNSAEDLMITLNIQGSNNAPVISTTSVPATCIGNNGSVTVSVTGGAPPYTYSWAPGGQTTTAVTGLSAGIYTVTITNSGGCTRTAIDTVTGNPMIATATATNVNCNGGNNGSATVSVTSGGTAPYTYAWSPSGGNAQTATGLAAGSYTVLTTDAGGCTTSSMVTITQPTALTVTATPGAGSASATTTGGTPGYTYLWNTAPVQSTATATGLAAGTYTVCVTDSKGCTSCNTVTVINGAGVNELLGGASIVISPNPFTSSANINISLLNPAHQNLFFTIYDIYGREIKSVDLTNVSSNPTIDFTLNRGFEISSGLYFYNLHNNTHILTSGKLMVQ